MPLTRQQLALALARKQSSRAKTHKPKTSSNLRTMTTSEEPAPVNPGVEPMDDSAVPKHLKSWLPGVASIDDLIPLPSDFIIAKTTPGPKWRPDGMLKPDETPKPEDHGKNRGLKASTVRQLNVRLRKYGLVMKRIVPVHVDPIKDVQTNSETIQSSDEIAEYEIVGIKGESKTWVLNTLAAAAEDDKADKVFRMQAEKERAEKAERAAEGDGQEEDASSGNGDDNETAVDSDGEDPDGNGNGRKRTGSGPPLGVFYEKLAPAAISKGGK